MTDVIFVVVSALILLAYLFPSPLWVHAIHRNSGPLVLLVWVFLLCAIGLVNGLVWNKDDRVRAPAWCDFTAAVKFAGPTALASSHFVLAVFLVRVLRTSRAALKHHDRIAHSVYDYLVAIGLPISVMAFHPLYQPTRFGVARTTGCQPTMAVTMPSFFLGLLHPPVISFFGLLASAYIGWAIIQYRHHVDKLARPCEAFYSARLFLRLCVLVVILAPICFTCSLLICLHQFRSFGPYRARLAADRSRIEHYPDVARANTLDLFPVLVGIVAVLLLGPGAETAAVASRFGDVLGLRAAFNTTRRRWSEHCRHSRMWGSPEEAGYDATEEPVIEPDQVVGDIDSLRPSTQASMLPPLFRDRVEILPHSAASTRANTLNPGAPIPPPPSPSSFTRRPSYFASTGPSLAMAGLKPLPVAKTRQSASRIAFGTTPTAMMRR